MSGVTERAMVVCSLCAEYTPIGEWLERVCSRCGRPVWLSPETQKLIEVTQRVPEFVCGPCFRIPLDAARYANLNEMTPLGEEAARRVRAQCVGCRNMEELGHAVEQLTLALQAIAKLVREIPC